MRRILNVRVLSEPIPFQMGLQVSCGIRAQGPKASDLRTDATAIGTDFPCTGATKGMPDSGRTSDAGPCTYVHCHSAQTPGGFGHWISEGKSAIAIARLRGRERNFSGEHFWARGYAVSTVGFELEQVRQYIREQQSADGTEGQF